MFAKIWAEKIGIDCWAKQKVALSAKRDGVKNDVPNLEPRHSIILTDATTRLPPPPSTYCCYSLVSPNAFEEFDSHICESTHTSLARGAQLMAKCSHSSIASLTIFHPSSTQIGARAPKSTIKISPLDHNCHHITKYSSIPYSDVSYA
jgi:hypothetical protein